MEELTSVDSVEEEFVEIDLGGELEEWNSIVVLSSKSVVLSIGIIVEVVPTDLGLSGICVYNVKFSNSVMAVNKVFKVVVTSVVNVISVELVANVISVNGGVVFVSSCGVSVCSHFSVISTLSIVVVGTSLVADVKVTPSEIVLEGIVITDISCVEKS